MQQNKHYVTFKGEATVKLDHTVKGISQHVVDLDRNICTCANGAALRIDGYGIEKTNVYCHHKLQAMGSQTSKHPELFTQYIKALSSRYIVWEVVSAFHKELRRGDYPKAIYWGTLLSGFRRPKGVIKYMLNIIYEETRDHALHDELLRVYEDIANADASGESSSIETVNDIFYLIYLFCKSVKKWNLPERYDIFCSEMRGYQQLAKKFTYEVAKPSDIISSSNHTQLKQKLLDGFTEGDSIKVQYGLKGLFKSMSKAHEAHKFAIYSYLIDDVYNTGISAFSHDSDVVYELINLLNKRVSIMGSIGYHELNCLCDALCGETASYKLYTEKQLLEAKTIASSTAKYPYGDIRNIPLYAQDNHTYKGKALMKNYRYQLEPEANQTNLDFRYCGAYFGVAWRMQAAKQLDTITCKWSEVKWESWLYTHVNNMWY